jgi:hypothetical protein
MATAAEAVIGHNQPPEPTPYEAIKLHIEDLMETAQGFLDGEPITTQAMADEVGKLLAAARDAEKAAEAQRVIEKRPHDEAAKAVQALWTPLTAKCGLVASTAKRALAPFLEAEQAKRDAEAVEARKLAEALAAEAQAALQAAAATDLAAREQAEDLLKEAGKADRAANRAGKGRASAAGGARAVSLRTSYVAEVTDYTAFARWAWTHRRAEYEAFLVDLAEREGRNGPVSIPGIIVHTKREAA